jgi:hypothetical protein
MCRPEPLGRADSFPKPVHRDDQTLDRRVGTEPQQRIKHRPVLDGLLSEYEPTA